jgi:hypothetical protein
MAAEQPCTLPDRYKDWESFLAELPDAVAQQQPGFYALKLVAQNGLEGGSKNAHDIAAKVNADLGLEFTDDYFGPAKLERLLADADMVLDTLNQQQVVQFPLPSPSQTATPPETNTTPQKTSSRSHRHTDYSETFTNLTAAAAAISIVAIGVFHAFKGIVQSVIDREPEPEPTEHVMPSDANRAWMAMNGHMRHYMDMGGAASTNVTTRNATLQEYARVDNARGVAAGTTHQEMDAIANLTDGKHVFDKGMYYQQRQDDPEAPLVKDWEKFDLPKVPTPDEVSAYIQSQQWRH